MGSKLSYEIMDDAAQVFLKSKIMDNIHKYFYMIAFTGYIREMAALAISTATDEDKAKHGLAGGKISTPGDQLKLAKPFVAWMEEHAKLSPSPPATSRPTSARSSTTSTRRLTPCSQTCPRATTRSVPSTGSPRRP